MTHPHVVLTRMSSADAAGVEELLAAAEPSTSWLDAGDLAESVVDEVMTSDDTSTSPGCAGVAPPQSSGDHAAWRGSASWVQPKGLAVLLAALSPTPGSTPEELAGLRPIPPGVLPG